MNLLLAIALGGSAGAITRFIVANSIYGWLGRGFPTGTLFINVSGCFLMGLLTEILTQRWAVGMEWRAAILVGFLGAYTTFSTFALETLYLFETGDLLKAFLSILLSTLLCMLAVWIGLAWGRSLLIGPEPTWTAQGLHYLWLAIGWSLAFGLATLLNLTAHWQEWPGERLAVVFILLLGLLTVVSTLWIHFRVSEARLALAGLFMLFTLNGLCGAGMLWLANHTGNWLWQLNPSR